MIVPCTPEWVHQVGVPLEVGVNAGGGYLAWMAGAFNTVFDAMGTTLPEEQLVPFQAPAQGNGSPVSLSTSDESMILVYLAYLSSLDAVSILTQVGGDPVGACVVRAEGRAEERGAAHAQRRAQEVAVAPDLVGHLLQPRAVQAVPGHGVLAQDLAAVRQ